MKKIIAILVSVSLLILQAQPVAAQLPRKPLVKGLANIKLPASKYVSGKLKDPRLLRLDTDLFKQMRLPLTQNYAALLHSNPALTPAQQILAHPHVDERALLLRSDFVALALNNRASAGDIAKATDFYRENLRQFKLGTREQTVQAAADIASLGIFGSAEEDVPLILHVLAKTVRTTEEPIFTAAAARAFLRLGAYEELEHLASVSLVQPDLWDGIAAYAQVYQLPLQIEALKPPYRVPADISDFATRTLPLGPLNAVAIDPSLESTYLYMNAGKDLATTSLPAAPTNGVALDLSRGVVPLQVPAGGEPLIAAPTQTAALAMANKAAQEELATLVTQYKPATFSAQTQQLMAKTQDWVRRLKPTALDETTFAQRSALYLTAFSIGLEIGTPIMASIKSALNLPLTFAILVTAATYAPYLFGSFIANWLKTKIGRKGTINTGLAMMGGSFALGATALGLDGSFTAWDNPMAQYLSLLGVLTTASTGAVFIHNAAGPIMTEISKKASDLVRQKRGTYIELSRSVGMMASFGFPFIATSLLGLDWSAPFLLALPVVGASALALNWAKLPNTKPHVLPAPKMAQSPVMDGVRKARKSMHWKDSLLNNSYVRLLKEEPGVGSFITSLFLMNAVEMGINSGFLFMLPKLTTNESSQYLFGMTQFAIPFLLGRYMASYFLKWFPQRNISVATLLAGGAALASLGMTDNVYALTAALFASELGTSTAFTLAYARTAKNHLTQDRVTSLIMATAVSCALGPVLFTQVAEGIMNAGVLNETGATVAALIGIPSLLALLSAKLFRRMENKTTSGISTFKQEASRWLAQIKKLLRFA